MIDKVIEAIFRLIPWKVLVILTMLYTVATNVIDVFLTDFFKEYVFGNNNEDFPYYYYLDIVNIVISVTVSIIFLVIGILLLCNHHG